jgi:hypothetical protein
MRLLAIMSGCGAVLLTVAPCFGQTLTKTADLDFGKLVPLSTSAAVAISPVGVRTPSGMLVSGGGQQAASFTVNGNPGAIVTISFGTPSSLSGPGSDMGLSAFTTSLVNNEGTLTGGTLTFTVGATLSVGGNQVPGTYQNGAIPVTVVYKFPP